MNDLFDITNQLYNVFETINGLPKSSIIQSKIDILFQAFLRNELNIIYIIKKFKWGSITNIDLLVEFLKQTIFISFPHGSYEGINKEKEVINRYYNEKKENVYKAIQELIYINTFMNHFIIFVRENYDDSFMRSDDLAKQEDVIEMWYYIPNMCRSLLNVGDYSYNGKLKTANEVLVSIHKKENDKEKLIEDMISNEKYKTICIQMYHFYLSEIERFLKIVNNSESKSVLENKKNIFIHFAYFLQEFMEKRLNCFSLKVIKK